MMRRALAVFALLAVAGCDRQQAATTQPGGGTTGTTTASAPPAPVQPRLTALPSFAPTVERLTPAVVNVLVLSGGSQNPLARDPFFRRFLPPGADAQPRVQSAGSGVIVDAKRGLILTNNHVVEGAGRVEVTLKDNRRLTAQIVGTDPATDIAVLRVQAENLVAVPLGNSDQLRIGDFVIAVGDPFGIGQTVTSGIVSALGRGGFIPGGIEDFIQTDAPINPGNSGGALANLAGELVGINSAIIGPGGNIGIGFAVPSNLARTVMEQIVAFGEVRRGAIGVAITDLPPSDGRTGPLAGALVADVVRGSPAAEAGLRSGDVIVAVDGREVRNASDLRTRVGLSPVGEPVGLQVLRGGQTLTVSPRVERLRNQPQRPPLSRSPQ